MAERKCIVSVEGNDIWDMKQAVEKELGPRWKIVRIDADLSMIDVSNDEPEWLPGPWRARFTLAGVGP